MFFIGVLFSMSFVVAQEEVFDSVSGGEFIGKLVDEDGQPKGITDVKDKVYEFREQNGSYLWRSWGKILNENPIMGPMLYYAEQFFAFFNPLWKYSFGTEFSWSIAFFLHMFLWIVIIIALYYPAKELFDNSIAALITGFVVASITGGLGVLTRFVNVIDVAFGELGWITFIAAALIIILLILEKYFFKSLDKEAEKEELERAKDSTLARGRVDARALKDTKNA